MGNRISMPKERRPIWVGLSDEKLVEYFQKELETRSSLTIREWDVYNAAWKRIDPEGYSDYRAQAAKRIDMKNAKERLSIQELEQIIKEKQA